MLQLSHETETLARRVAAPFDLEQANATFGKGSGLKARLNLADCAAYALAKTRSTSLLFKGDDFTHTDIEQYRR